MAEFVFWTIAAMPLGYAQNRWPQVSRAVLMAALAAGTVLLLASGHGGANYEFSWQPFAGGAVGSMLGWLVAEGTM